MATTQPITEEITLDLAELARVDRGDRIEVEGLADVTQRLFHDTLQILETAQIVAETDAPDSPGSPSPALHEDINDLPDDSDLRKIYIFAEALGGYETFNDLMNVYSPGKRLAGKYLKKVLERPLTKEEARVIEEYHAQLNAALKSANQWLLVHDVEDKINREVIRELHELLMIAQERTKELSKILGAHLIYEIEAAVKLLSFYREKIQAVRRTPDGIFLVDQEVMFIPTYELVECVNVIFKGVGNPYLAGNIDGVLLLAARNLLIEVCSFYSYYGKHQIYTLFKKSGRSLKPQVVVHHIRKEIRRLFSACQRDNKLVLKRIMRNTETEFVISIDSIQREAEEVALEQVRLILPELECAPPPAKKKSLFGRLFGWLTST